MGERERGREGGRERRSAKREKGRVHHTARGCGPDNLPHLRTKPQAWVGRGYSLSSEGLMLSHNLCMLEPMELQGMMSLGIKCMAFGMNK